MDLVRFDNLQEWEEWQKRESKYYDLYFEPPIEFPCLLVAKTIFDDDNCLRDVLYGIFLYLKESGGWTLPDDVPVLSYEDGL